MYDLVVLGGSAQGLSTAITAQSVGASNVLVLEPGLDVAYPHLVGQQRLNIAYGQNVTGIDKANDYLTITTAEGQQYEARTCVVALNAPDAKASLPQDVLAGERIHEVSFDGDVEGKDILIVGDNDRAVVLASQYVNAGARTVVLAASGMNPDLLANASRDELKRMEKNRELTVLYRAAPKEIGFDDEGNPWIEFVTTKPKTPSLVFDHVVFAATQKLVEAESIGITDDAISSDRIKYVRDPRLDFELPSATGDDAVVDLSEFFSECDTERIKAISVHTRDYASAPEDLAAEYYNATITHFDPRHSDLWVLRVKPDRGEVSFVPGQYTTLGLGFWEPRVDNAVDPNIENIWQKLWRNSYSISCRIFDDNGYLIDPNNEDELEFYIVLAQQGEGKPPPRLTPRLALKKPGDRIFLGGKVTGYYTLADVKPDDNVIFFATGTGEAPHNPMIVDLLRRGHKGKIISAVNVRSVNDLGYREEHERLQELYPNYTYFPLPTREDNIPRRYCQDLVRDGDIERVMGAPLTPETTHVFACGTPNMIGAPNEATGEVPDNGIVGLFVERGFSVATKKTPGQIHYELW